MSIIYRYILITIACVAVLIGVQIPNYINQYESRLDAHFIEVKINLRGFQEIADRYYNGSIELLIKKHEASEDKTFREEAKPIRDMYERYLRFKEEKQDMQTGLIGKIFHLVLNGDRELMDETFDNYIFNVPMNREAVIVGFLFAASILIEVEILKSVFVRFYRYRKTKKRMERVR